MTIGSSLVLIAIGAILRYGVQDSIEAIDLVTIGLILMIVGVIGLIIGIWQTARLRPDRPVDPGHVSDPADPRYRRY